MIGQGADWSELWSLAPPRRPRLPNLQRSTWSNNPLDAFILARLEEEGLEPSTIADKVSLIRRVTLDLTGLPPTLDEVDAFVADRSPHSYERLVDRLLASPRYGERVAVQWLDAARYADTSGYQMDGPRDMWRWRDWVIDALNAGMPYDQFTVEQLAGDLLPNPSLDQLIATGFNRNHRGNAEGGIIPEEYRVEYVVDRVETTSTVWLGLTMGCARCHDHKYDPITQRDFYRFYSFFNNVPERGKARKWGNSKPQIKAPTGVQRQALAALDHEIAAAELRTRQLENKLLSAQRQWEGQQESLTAHGFDQLLGDPVVHLTMDNAHAVAGIATTGAAVSWEGEPEMVDGRLGHAGLFDGTRYFEVGDVAGFDYDTPFSISAWVLPHGSAGGAIVSKMQSDTDERKGYSIELIDGHWHINIVRRWLDDCLRVRTVQPFPADEWQQILVTYDGSKLFEGARLYVNGDPCELEIIVDDLQQPIVVADPFRIGARGRHHRFHGLIDDVRLYDQVLAPEQARLLATSDPIDRITALPPTDRNANQSYALRRFFIESQAPDDVRAAHHHLAGLRRQRARLEDEIGSVMVMREMSTPRDTFILNRGQYDDPGEKVAPNVPEFLPSMAKDSPPNRLGLARWIVDSANPLTARVAANRAWQLLFGEGLVRTAEDFGSQGEKPTHPRLLDWLAVELVEGDWDLKRLHRKMVTSATYRQSSTVSPIQLAEDPANQLWGRTGRFRMSAHRLRDQALTTSGLLVEQLGGPSVKPYQPSGLWVELTLEESRYVQDTGAQLYRRSLYTYWKRTVAPPGMLMMDASPREACTVRMSRTNTPLQALSLMNDVTFVEAARALAERILLAGHASDPDRLAYAFRMVTSRLPTPAESRILKSALDFQRQRFSHEPLRAEQLVQFGDSPAASSLEPVELAAHTVLMNLLLNLDEAITRQ